MQKTVYFQALNLNSRTTMNTHEQEYWTKFYQNTIARDDGYHTPSAFARWVQQRLSSDGSRRILDMGCGNGRDSLFLAAMGHSVTAIDAAFLPPEGYFEQAPLSFHRGDMVSFDKGCFEVFYMRFSLHSIPDSDQIKLLRSLPTNSTIFLETRSDIDKSQHKVHAETHYRNYTNLSCFLKMLSDLGFHVEYVKQSRGLAIWQTEDPMCIRIIAHKPSFTKPARDSQARVPMQ